MRLTRISLGVVLLAGLTGLVLAAQQQTPQPESGPQRMGGPGMAAMMSECQAHHQAMRTALDTALATAKAALESNDPSRMRAALAEVETSLASLQQRVATCTTRMQNMSTMMGTMMGMMGGRQGMGMMRGRPDGGTPPPQTTPER